MDNNLLAAITGAVSAYIEREQNGKAISGGNTSNWWLSGQLEQMRARINTRKIRPHSVMIARKANTSGKDISMRQR